MHPRIVSLVTLIALSVGLPLTYLQAQADRVEIKNVKFASKVRPYGDYMIEVEVEAKGNPKDDPEVINKDYVDNVKVTLLVGYEHPSKPNEFIFHESSVTIATLEVRQSKLVGFWIPADIADRDNVTKEPQYWVVDLSVGGADVPVNDTNIKKRASSTLNLSTLQSMRNRASNPTEGIMLPGYLSGNGYRGADDRPAFIRIEEN